MSRQIIADLERDLERVLVKYETENEVTTAEVCGILGILKTGREMKAILPFCKDLLKDLLEEPAEAQSGAPVGEMIHLERKEGSDMEN